VSLSLPRGGGVNVGWGGGGGGVWVWGWVCGGESRDPLWPCMGTNERLLPFDGARFRRVAKPARQHARNASHCYEKHRRISLILHRRFLSQLQLTRLQLACGKFRIRRPIGSERARNWAVPGRKSDLHRDPSFSPSQRTVQQCSSSSIVAGRSGCSGPASPASTGSGSSGVNL